MDRTVTVANICLTLIVSTAAGWLAAREAAPVATVAPEPSVDSVELARLRQIDAALAGVDTRTSAAPAWQAEQLPPVDAPAREPRLRALADDGNAYAAKELSELLKRCRFYQPRTQRELDVVASQLAVVQAQIAEARVEAIENALDTELPAAVIDEVDMAEVIIADELKREHECAGVDTRMAAREWFDWYERAAGLGHPDAQTTYWQEMLRTHTAITAAELVRRKQLARTFLSSALGRGDAEALDAWSKVHRRGLFGEPDPTLAHAYLLAYVRSAAVGLAERMLLGAAADRAGQALSPAQRRLAEQLGKEIHQRCCRG